MTQEEEVLLTKLADIADTLGDNPEYLEPLVTQLDPNFIRDKCWDMWKHLTPGYEDETHNTEYQKFLQWFNQNN